MKTGEGRTGMEGGERMEQDPERGEEVVRAEMEMLPQIMKIIRDAQALLAEDGISQWQDGYPDEAVLRRDVLGGNCYVLRQEDEIRAVGEIGRAHV